MDTTKYDVVLPSTGAGGGDTHIVPINGRFELVRGRLNPIGGTMGSLNDPNPPTIPEAK